MPKSPIAKRYLHLVMYAFFSAIFFQMLASVESVQLIVGNYVRWVVGQHWIVRCGYYLTLMGLLYLLMVQTQVIPRLSHWSILRRRFWPYPPLWGAAMLGACFIWASAFSIEQGIVFLVIALILVVLRSLAAWHMVSQKQERSPHLSEIENSKMAKPSSESQLLKWLEKEEPVTEESQLWFDRKIYVDRIARRLGNSTRAQHVALCGEYGSGKSSVTRMVEKQLKYPVLNAELNKKSMSELQGRNQTWLTVNINSWGAEAEAIGSHILRQILNELNQYIDTSAFSPLPENYRNALKAKGGWLNVINEFIGKSNQNIEQQLKDLDDLFTALNFKMLIVLEDIDRSPKADELLNSLAVLIDKLKLLCHFHFIISVGYTEKSANIISRVCDYREDLSNESYVDILDEFLKLWIKRAEKERIFLSDQYLDFSSLKAFLVPRHDEGELPHYVFGSVDGAIDSLITNPRTLKGICRRVDSVWKKDRLMGEIDLVDTLLMYIIKDREPKLYSVLKLEYQTGSLGVFAFDNGGNGEWSTKRAAILAREVFHYASFNKGEVGMNNLWKDDNINEEAFLWKRFPSLAVLSPVFPIFHQFYNRWAAQKLSTKREYADYLSRFERESLGENESSDQRFIREMKQHQESLTGKVIKEEQSSFILNLLTNSLYFERFEEFFSWVSIKDAAAKRKWFRRLLFDSLRIVRTEPTQFIRIRDHSKNSVYTGDLISYLFDSLVKLGVAEDSLKMLYKSILKFIIMNQVSLFINWISKAYLIDGKGVVCYGWFKGAVLEIQDYAYQCLIENAKASYLEVALEKADYGGLVFGIKDHLVRCRDSSGLVKGGEYLRCSMPESLVDLFGVLISRGDIYGLVFIMYFFLDKTYKYNPMSPDQGASELTDIQINSDALASAKRIRRPKIEHSLYDEIKLATLKFKAVDYKKFEGGKYWGDVSFWLEHLKYKA